MDQIGKLVLKLDISLEENKDYSDTRNKKVIPMIHYLNLPVGLVSI